MKTKQSDPMFEYYDTVLDHTTCSEETLAYLSCSESERRMPLEEWKALYQLRLKDGYYDRLKAKEEAIKNHPLFKAIPPHQFGLQFKVYDELSASYPWPE